MKIALGSDHGGYHLKETIRKYLDEQNIAYEDFGTNSTESVDYPEFGMKVAEAVVSGACDRGILCCGTGIGISISANKVPGIRCAVVTETYSAKMSREHNNANVLALGERVVGAGLALEIVDVWIHTEFAGDRHARRVNMLGDIERKYSK
ncbi:ribose 5-phosphate isomerase B [Geosporobacter ferrireducens]|uniref:Ribose 5-phosphate isomerase B n=1 Tax=Geosporobacter ferrireducens TaxID=1424294 RepID=A0A1D8GGQ6_9FIRM|nr:ribose 5-phosphate isomerase B [Geosporobacter ferrireducens]AOT70088.1 ribose 5-phosphate isomerase B [Geosporobacter ferrireducens]MTI53364.1 ribose 5-phosphate isomerase B [Geosporobacter ferrireducens]